MSAAHELKSRLNGLSPATAIVLGSGLGGLVDAVHDPVRIPYGDLKGFPEGGVSGHAGEIVAGHVGQTPVIMLSGRVHYYENGNAAAMRLPIQTLAELDVERMVFTNSAGSLRSDLPPGSVMRITDHINWSGMNPLIGEPTDRRFVGMTNAYSKTMEKEIMAAADQAGLEIGQGVYMWFSGPSFETPAEIRMAKMLGADAVGMSTVPEVILARFFGLEVAAFSVITNMGAGITGNELSHDETREMAPLGGQKLARLITLWLSGEAS